MKKNKSDSLFSVSIKLIKRHPFFFLASMLSAFLLQFTGGLFPAFIEKHLFSFFENKVELPLGIWTIIILMVTMFLLQVIAYVTLKVSWLFRTKIKNIFVNKMLTAIILEPKDFIRDEATGETAYKFREDPEQIAYLLTTSFPHFSTSIVVAIMTVLLMFSVNIIFTCIALCLIVLNVVITTFLLPLVERWREDSLKAQAATSGFLTITLQSTQEIKTNYKNEYFIDAYFHINKNAEQASIRENIGNSIIESLFRLGHQLITACMLIFIALHIGDNNFSVGNIAFFMSLAVSLSNFAFSISGFIVTTKQTNISLKRVQDIYDKKKNADELPSLKNLAQLPMQSLVVKKLCIEYPESNFKIEKSFELFAGEYLFIVGAVGSGKSSVIKAMLGIAKKTSGEIILNGESVENPQAIFVSPFAVYVSPTPQIFNMSLRENLLIGVSQKDNVNISDAEIQNALRITRFDKDITTMSEGLETKVGNLTSGVSGGQAQRIGIARALLCKSKLLVLDDCFTAIDKILAEQIRHDIAQIKGLTVIELSNRTPNIDTIARVKLMQF